MSDNECMMSTSFEFILVFNIDKKTKYQAFLHLHEHTSDIAHCLLEHLMMTCQIFIHILS